MFLINPLSYHFGFGTLLMTDICIYIAKQEARYVTQVIDTDYMLIERR